MELTYLPCKETDEGCKVSQFRDAEGKMNTDKLWDQLGMVEIEILSLQQRMDQDDPFDPIKSETTLNRSYLKHQTPTWGNNRIRINRFSDPDTDSIWYPFPSARDEDQTFLSLQHNEDQHRSAWNDYEGGN